uniref:Uncharacterized protein n=1 Tax=Ditylum brightwellii TaxID=49249 RepID=A0A7S4WFV5_9STRA
MPQPKNALAVCVDINERALKFVQFNAMLNGLNRDCIRVIKGDLISRKCLTSSTHNNKRKGEEETEEEEAVGENLEMKQGGDDIDSDELLTALLLVGSRNDDIRKKQRAYDIILSNPPFIPVPPRQISPQQSSPSTSDKENGTQLKATMDGDAQQQSNAMFSRSGKFSSDSSDNTDSDIFHSIAQRYGLFSSGGPDGEDVLQSVVSLSSKLLRKDGGLLAIVSEFMNPPPMTTTTVGLSTEGRSVIEADNSSQSKTTLDDSDSRKMNGDDNLCHRMKGWWEKKTFQNNGDNDGHELVASSSQSLSEFGLARGILFTNEYPVSAMTYATRRADDATEYTIWEHHLHAINITHVSPGLLFVITEKNKREDEILFEKEKRRVNGLDLRHVLVPRSKTGSIWTAHNPNAVSFIRDVWSKFIKA